MEEEGARFVFPKRRIEAGKVEMKGLAIVRPYPESARLIRDVSHECAQPTFLRSEQQPLPVLLVSDEACSEPPLVCLLGDSLDIVAELPYLVDVSEATVSHAVRIVPAKAFLDATNPGPLFRLESRKELIGLLGQTGHPVKTAAR